MKEYITKDSGKRQDYASGMRRDLQAGKPRYDLIPIPMLTRLAGLYERGAVKYGDCNWMLANSEEELNRFKASAMRHMFQWANGEDDEDHASAIVFNVFAYETIREKMEFEEDWSELDEECAECAEEDWLDKQWNTACSYECCTDTDEEMPWGDIDLDGYVGKVRSVHIRSSLVVPNRSKSNKMDSLSR
jgi:hypothetical protein